MKATVGASALVETYGVKDRIKCRLVGWAVDEFVVLQAPLSPGIRSRISAGSQVSVRYLHSGELIGFRSEYIDFVIRPFPLLIVSYPNRFETHSLREAKRMSCACLASLSIRGGQYNGVLVDLSGGGCRFRFEAGQPLPKLKKGDMAEGYFSTLGNSDTYNFSGVVASLEDYKDDHEIGIGFDPEKTSLPDDLTSYLVEVSETMGLIVD